MKIVGYVFGSLRQCSHACFVPWLTARHKRIICVGRYNMDFRAIFHVRDERKLEPYVWQIQPNPCIFLSSEFSRTKCSLGDLSISCHAMFPCRVSPSGKASWFACCRMLWFPRPLLAVTYLAAPTNHISGETSKRAAADQWCKPHRLR